MYAKEIIWNFTCVFCSRFWSLALKPGEDDNVVNKELFCPWCGRKHTYIRDEHKSK